MYHGHHYACVMDTAIQPKRTPWASLLIVKLHLFHISVISYVLMVNTDTRLFKSFEFGNGSRMSDENLVILEFKYLQNKKW